MSNRVLLRLSGLAAIVAGTLRSAASFLPYSEPTVIREILYFTIDIFILFGVLGIFLYQNAEVGKPGFLGFLLAVTGTAIIVGPDSTLSGIPLYETGAFTLSVGLSLLAVGSWNAGRLPKYASACWIVSTSFGVGGALVGGTDFLTVLAGLAFGIGFIGAGARIWSDPVLQPISAR